MIPNTEQLINGDKEALRLWNEWARDAITYDEAMALGGVMAGKVRDTEVLTIAECKPSLGGVIVYENEEDLPDAIVEGGGRMMNARTVPNALLGTISEGEHIPCEGFLSRCGIRFHNARRLDPGHFFLFNDAGEMFSRSHDQVFNIPSNVVEIMRKDLPNDNGTWRTLGF